MSTYVSSNFAGRSRNGNNLFYRSTHLALPTHTVMITSPYPPISPHLRLPSEEQPLGLFHGLFFPWLLGQVFPLPLTDIVLKNPPYRDSLSIMQLIDQGQKPIMVPHHIGRLDRIFQ